MSKTLQATRPQQPNERTSSKGAQRPPSASQGSDTTKPASAAATDAQPVPALVVFGTDAAGKPRAAYFEAAQADLATRAASLMNLRVVKVSGPAGEALARQLPAGKIYESGRGFVPFIRRDLYERLFTTAAPNDPGAETTAAGEGGSASNPKPVNGREDKTGTKASSPPPSAPPSTPKLPRTWDEIGVGSLVLASEGTPHGWWEAIVERVDGPLLTLKWRDFPKAERAVMRREQLALIYPGDAE